MAPTLPSAVYQLLRRLSSGESGWLAYDHGHRAYVVFADDPTADEGIDLIGFYNTNDIGLSDILAAMKSFEDEDPAFLRGPRRCAR